MTETTEVKTHQYEGMFILDANLAGKHWDKAKGQLKELLENYGAEIIRMEKWEERKLAYEIRKQKRGVYVLCYFKVATDQIPRIRRGVRLSEWILRELILTHGGEVTDDLFRKPRTREKDREEGPPRRRGGPGARDKEAEPAAAPPAGETAPAAPAEAAPAATPAPAEKQE